MTHRTMNNKRILYHGSTSRSRGLVDGQTSEMFYMHLPVLRRGVARIRLRHLVGMSFSFVVIVFVLVFASGGNEFSSQSWSPPIQGPDPIYSPLEVKEEMDRRREHAHQACKRQRKEVSWFTLAIVVFRPLKLAYCHVPKTGTTIWTSVYRYLNQDLYPNYLNNPFQMRKFYVHHKQMRHFETLDIFHEGHGYLDTSFNILFVRDPYTRLYSVYLEKLYLPDMWNNLGVEIVKHFRPYAIQRSSLCGKDVTFLEFIQYVVQSETKHLKENDHVSPITNRCHPCGIRYDVIGKEETFSRDVEFTLNKSGLHELVRKFRKTDWGERLIQDLVHQCFMSLEHFTSPACVDVGLVVKRLWQVFQLKGLLPVSSPPPDVDVSLSNDIIIDKVTQEALRQYNEALPRVDDQRTRWRKSLTNAWADVPRTLLAQIRKTYKDDFDILDYDPYPSDIFKAE